MDIFFITVLEASQQRIITLINPMIRATSKFLQGNLFAYWMISIGDDELDPRAAVHPGVLDDSALYEWSVTLLSRSVHRSLWTLSYTSDDLSAYYTH